ncbi:Vgb family protein [Enhygromyxa salina]|uniref:Virginiamycin B lyase n=1 Tax=Enhygromyxa salina TaxID=215803 RepID=A0A2S9XTU5_9BACT|nr:hypothetical protein [Enhygromyxa salina]PRP96131.1 Virginiamycin B lyase [Enhygromyxa salina]
MRDLQLSLVLVAAVSTVGCGDPNARPGDGDGETSGLTTVNAETGESSDTDSDTDPATTTASTTSTTTDGEPKFDLGPLPDGATDCGSGEGGGMGDFSYIWIANSTQGTVSKIETVSTIEEGRYAVTNDLNMQSSRTSVNQYGDVAIGHRFAPRVTKVAARVENCIDKNNNGMIDTSSGAGDVRPFLEDECTLWSIDLPNQGNGTRAVAWEGGSIDPDTCENTIPNPRLWVGYGQNPLQVYRLDGETGAVLDHVQVASSGFVYGGAVNADGDFWVSDRSGRTLSRVDAETLEVSVFPVPGSAAYGMGVDQNGHPWIATHSVGVGDFVYRFDPDLQTFTSAGGTSGRYRGMNIDREGRAWVAGNSPCRLALFDAVQETVINDAIELPGCVDPVGVSVDRDGYVWVVDRGASVAWKVDPNFHIVVGTVNGLVNPYTYSDMTGQGLNLVVNPPG